MSRLFEIAVFIPCLCILIYYNNTILENISHLIKSNPSNVETYDKKPDPKCVPQEEKLFTPTELARYDGKHGAPELFLGYLGIVYDVSKGDKHYGPGGSYSFFAGKDATRAFVTGEFNDNGLTDDVEGLDLDSFGGIRDWQEFYETEYKRVGRVIGAYFDNHGCPTVKLAFVDDAYKRYDDLKSDDQAENEIFPHCNSEWNGDTNSSRVWCTALSGGSQRDWVGVPRQLHLPRQNTYRCACVRNTGTPSVPSIQYADETEATNDKENSQTEGDLKNPRLKEYPNCDPSSYECKLS